MRCSPGYYIHQIYMQSYFCTSALMIPLTPRPIEYCGFAMRILSMSSGLDNHFDKSHEMCSIPTTSFAWPLSFRPSDRNVTSSVCMDCFQRSVTASPREAVCHFEAIEILLWINRKSYWDERDANCMLNNSAVQRRDAYYQSIGATAAIVLKDKIVTHKIHDFTHLTPKSERHSLRSAQCSVAQQIYCHSIVISSTACSSLVNSLYACNGTHMARMFSLCQFRMVTTKNFVHLS